MKLVTDRNQRNYNYLEIIAAYNKLVESCANAIEEAEDTDAVLINQAQFDEFKSELAMKLIGLDDLDDIIDAVTSDERVENASLDLLDFGGDDYALCKKGKILPTASREEALILYSMLKNGDFDLFLSDKTKKKIEKNLAAFFANLNEESVNLYDFIEVKGRSLCADELNGIKECFAVISSAARRGGYVKISYFYNDETKEYIIKPAGFVYSQLDLRLRVKAYVETGEMRTFYISNIKSFEKVKGVKLSIPKSGEPLMKELIFSFENTLNRAERVAARFSDYNKTVDYNKKENTVSYVVEYPDNMTENNRIFFRLRSLGKGIDIESEEKERVRADALKALENYR